MNLSWKRRKAMQQQEEEYQVIERIPTVEEYLALREAVGWERLDEQITARALANALFTVCILHNGKVIGCGRIIGDGGLYFYIQNIMVLPAYQGKGLGKRLMLAILAYLEKHALPGAFIGLMAAKDASSFYTQFGFAVRPPERPGMFLLREELQPSTTS
jgi:GNAT superfamily N-acetyltransferase